MGGSAGGWSLTGSIVAVLLWLVVSTAAQQPPAFRCSSRGATCNAIIDYVLPNSTTLSAVQALFNVRNLRSILGANNLSLSTPPTRNFTASSTLKIPFPCTCTGANGTGISNRRPVYTVVPGDGLDHIARDVFSALVTFQQIQAVNNISNANQIDVGQRLWIPLPCSCDAVDGQPVVHYGHVVPSGSSVEGIAQQYNTTQDTLLRLNGLSAPNQLEAGAVLDVPLRVCTSMVGNNSRDYPLLVPNGTYVFTATNCVMCNCNAANNWVLQCESTQFNSSLWPSCPSMQCQGSEILLLGNTTSSSGCNRSTCTYAGYTNQTILTTLASESTCPASSSAISLQGWKWSITFTLAHLFLLLACVHSFHW